MLLQLTYDPKKMLQLLRCHFVAQFSTFFLIATPVVTTLVVATPTPTLSAMVQLYNQHKFPTIEDDIGKWVSD